MRPLVDSIEILVLVTIKVRVIQVEWSKDWENRLEYINQFVNVHLPYILMQYRQVRVYTGLWSKYIIAQKTKFVTVDKLKVKDKFDKI